MVRCYPQRRVIATTDSGGSSTWAWSRTKRIGQGSEHVAAQAVGVGVGAARVVDALVDGAAHVLHEAAEEARVHRRNLETRVQGQGCVAHDAPVTDSQTARGGHDPRTGLSTPVHHRCRWRLRTARVSPTPPPPAPDESGEADEKRRRVDEGDAFREPLGQEDVRHLPALGPHILCQSS